MLRNAHGYFEYRPLTLPKAIPKFVGRGFQTIERHVDDGLENETEATLNRRIKADLVDLCHERGLPSEGEKQTLIGHLLNWVRGII